MARKHKKKKPLSGTIPCTWARCPNVRCASHNWEKWDIDFENGDFWCGTCMTKLKKPVIGIPIQILKEGGELHEKLNQTDAGDSHSGNAA